MPDLLSEQEFTEHFTQAISAYNLSPYCKEPLTLELHYGAEEPILTLSLKEAFERYRSAPDSLSEVLQPYVQDLGWTVQDPRLPSKELYENCLPTLRNMYLNPPNDDELGLTPDCKKGPIALEDVLRAPTEYIVMEFSLFKDKTYTPLRKGDTLPCIPDNKLLAQLSLHNLALSTETAGITATPLQFESLNARSWLVGLGDDTYKPSIAALSCIPPVIASLQETFRGENGLIAIMPAADQLIISIDTNDQAIVEFGVLAQQLKSRAPNPLSTLVWQFKAGQLDAVQALELQEIQSTKPEENV